MTDNSNFGDTPTRFDRFTPRTIAPLSRRPVRLAEGGSGVEPLVPIGDIRLRVLDREGKPVPGAQARITVRDDGARVEQRVVSAGPTGFASTRLASSRRDSTTVEVEPLVDGKADGAQARKIDPGDGSGVSEVFQWDRIDRRLDRLRNSRISGFTQPPEIPDVELAPELFSPTIIEEDGNCALDFAANVETRQYYFNQLVRREAPELRQSYARHETSRDAIEQPVPFDWGPVEPSAPVHQFRTPSLGKLNTYKHSWTRLGHGVGQLLYSLALAPCEQTRIAVIEWSREESGRRAERSRFDEAMQHELRRDRAIQEIVDAVADEMQRGESESSQVGGGLTGGLGSSGGKSVGSLGFSIGGSSASSESFSEGHREINVSTLQNISDRVTQSGSAMRSLKSMVVTESAQAEGENIRTRVVRNHNQNHALTVEYFQVLEHYAVRTELHAQRDVLLVPYQVPRALWAELPPYTRFRSSVEEIRESLSEIPGPLAREFASRDGQTPEDEGRRQIERAVRDALEQAEIDLKMGEDVETVIVWTIQHAWAKLQGATVLVVRVQFEEALRDRLRDALAGVRRTQPEALLQTSELLAWLDAHREQLRRLVPQEHVAGLDALFRLVHTPEAYETDVPRATASRWTVELREAWRSGVAITVHAGQQAIALTPAEDRPNSAIGRFTSPPVDIERVDRIEVTFAPEEATKTVVKNIAEDMGVLEQVGETVAGLLSTLPGDMEKMVQRRVEETREYVLSRLRVSAHTDLSDDLPRSKTYEILDHTATGSGVTLKASNPSYALEVSNVPQVDFLVTSTRRYRDYERLEKLAQHVKQNRMAYLRALWLREDPDRRALRFAEWRHQLEDDGESVPLLQLIENQPVGVFGNQVAFPILSQGRWELYAPVDDDETVEERLVTLPSRGVYAETLLSKCNAREIRDVKRMYDPEERCPGEAPGITGVSPGSRRSAQDLQPSDMPAPVVQPQSAPQAPAPQGMSAALQAIASGGMFRDMSLGSETVQSARVLADRAMRESGEAQRAALDALDQKLAQAQSEARSAAAQDAVEEGRRQVGAARQAAQNAATQAHRSSDAQTNRDHQQNLDEAHQSGALSEESHRRGSERLHNAAESGGEAQAASGFKDFRTRQLVFRQIYFDKGEHTVETGEGTKFADHLSDLEGFVEDGGMHGGSSVTLVVRGIASREKEDPDYDNEALSKRRAEWTARQIAERLAESDVQDVEIVPVAGGVGQRESEDEYWKDQRADVIQVYQQAEVPVYTGFDCPADVKDIVLRRYEAGDRLMIRAEKEVSLDVLFQTIANEGIGLIIGRLTHYLPMSKVGEGVHLLDDARSLGTDPFTSPDEIERNNWCLIYKRYLELKGELA